MDCTLLITCKGHHFTHIEHFNLENTIFSNHSNTAVRIENTTTNILGSQFLFNSGGSCQRNFNFAFNRSSCINSGGAIVLTSSHAVISNTTFEGNNAESGGAIFSLNSCIEVHSSMFIRNTAQLNNDIVLLSRDSGFGATFTLFGSLISIHQCDTVFTNNEAQGDAGVLFTQWNGSSAIWCLPAMKTNVMILSQTIISNSQFINNSASDGGVIKSFKNTLLVGESTFMNNTAMSCGGVIHATLMANIVLTDNTFVNNRALRNGGVIYVNGTNTNITNSTFTSNRALEGSVLYYIRATVHRVYTDDQGVLYSGRALVFISTSRFFRNTASDTSGVISMPHHNTEHVQLEILHSVFKAHSATVLYVLGHVNLYCNHCVFFNNRANYGSVVNAQGPKLTITMTSCHLINNSAHGDGGVMYVHDNALVHIQHSVMRMNSAVTSGRGGVLYFFKCNIILQNNTFYNNSAVDLGGVAYIEHSNLTIIESKMEYNVANYSGATIYATPECKISVTKTRINYNSASEGVLFVMESELILVDITFSHNNGSLYAFNSKIVLKGFTTLIVHNSPLNSLQEGGAITSFQSEIFFHDYTRIFDNFAGNGGAVLAIKSKINVLGQIMVANNTAAENGGGIYLQQSELECLKLSVLNLTENHANERGGGVYAFSSIIKVTYHYDFIQPAHKYKGAKLQFNQNKARLGGGIFLQSYAQVYTLDKFHAFSTPLDIAYAYIFVNNSAEYGGAMYVDDNSNSVTCNCSSNSTSQISQTTSECFTQLLQQSEPTTQFIHTIFEDNRASNTGQNLYGGLLDRCTTSSFGNHYGPVMVTNGLTFFKATSMFEGLHTISSKPMRVCFCREDTQDCNYQPKTISVKKGENFTVQVIAVDQVEKPLDAYIRTVLISSESGLGRGLLLHSIKGNCTSLTFNIFSPFTQ